MMDRRFMWASPHQPTEDQLAELGKMGQVEMMSDVDPELLARLMDSPASREELDELVMDLTFWMPEYVIVQPAGSPAFQFRLGAVLVGAYTTDAVLYAHSKRVSQDHVQPDGSVRKVSVFKHMGFI